MLQPIAIGAKMEASEWIPFIDESGGPLAAEPVLRQAGWGVAALQGQAADYDCALRSGQHDPPPLVGGVAATLAGQSQTSDRAALAALSYIVQKFVGNVVVGPDSEYVYDRVLKARYRAPTGANADLWH